MKTKIIRAICLLFTIALLTGQAFSQKNNDPVTVNKNGRIIWNNNKQEAFFWGVNYTVPFAHAYRQIARVGEDLQKVIDHDTYHLARLGINAYRIHVWDCEISDSTGNLLENEHLKLLDYLVFRLQQRGVYSLFTPIAYWGNGYPEPNEKVPGFSGKYNKGNVYTDPGAIACQERYLIQFLNHVNPYTGKAYKNDPMVIGFEICNEPGHNKALETTAFVKKMIAAVKSTGCTKPVFYNVTQNISLLEDFIKGGTDGVTFQWYPSGLVANHEVQGNFLPHVDRYEMPFKSEKFFVSQARIVYEFDPADVGRSYMYPPVALSFKEAGMQWVTQFAYDPVAIAASNTEYQTHFLNLAYAPQKAIGFKIAGELFRNPQFQRNRANEKKPFDIGGVNISYENDLAELITHDLFFYTNSTSSKPLNPALLKSVAGYGTSPVVSYKGRGAYFLDKIKDGVWRLEIMPDAVWVRDPFSRATPRIENVVIKWNTYDMTINLSDLDENFFIQGINEGNNHVSTARARTFSISPGAYILSDAPISPEVSSARIGNISVSEYHAPKETNNNFYFLHRAPSQVVEESPVVITVEVISPEEPLKNLVIHESFIRGFRGFRRPFQVNMEKVDAFTYQAALPESLVKPGTLEYVIVAEYESGKTSVFPGDVPGPVNSWEYYNPEAYTIKIIPAGSKVQLYHAETSTGAIVFMGNPRLRSHLSTSGIPGESFMQVEESATEANPYFSENLKGVAFAVENHIGDIIHGLSHVTERYKEIMICGRASDQPVPVELTLISRDGNAYSAKESLTSDSSRVIIRFDELTPGKQLLLPRPFPVFMPTWYTHKFIKPFVLSEIEKIQLIVPEQENIKTPSFKLSSIVLQ